MLPIHPLCIEGYGEPVVRVLGYGGRIHGSGTGDFDWARSEQNHRGRSTGIRDDSKNKDAREGAVMIVWVGGDGGMG